MLGLSWSGHLVPFAHTPVFEGTSNQVDRISAHLDESASTLLHTYPWGHIQATYQAIDSNRLDIKFTVKNTSSEMMDAIQLRVGRFNYPEVPVIQMIDSAAFPFSGGIGAASSAQKPPLVLAKFGEDAMAVGALDYSSDLTAGLFASEGTAHAVGLALSKIGPGEEESATLSLRFGPRDSTFRSLAGDVLDNFTATYPMTLVWEDRRPIGKIFLATMRNGPDRMETNPNRWFMNSSTVDVSTDAGMENFRNELMQMADRTVATLLENDHQGGVTWDPEGQRTGHTYYGDPRIIPDIAPEMEYKGAHELATIDAYFKKFDDAGLLHGICIRPQRVVKRGEFWENDEVKSEAGRLQEMREKIAYAVDRWNSRLIYIDSDYDVTAASYETLHREFPEVLLIPEWSQVRHYASTAPLKSFSHHGVTGIVPTIRELYPNAFIVNFLDNLPTASAEQREKIRQSVRGGDIPMVNGWYFHSAMKAVMELYED